MRHAQHGAANLAGALADLGSLHGVLDLVEAAGVAVDDGQRRAEFVRRHRHEIPLQQRQALLVRQLLLEQRRLAGERVLAAHQFERIVAEDHGGLRHFADLVAPPGLGNFDAGIVGGEAAHAVGETAERRGNRTADMDERGDDQNAGDHDGEKDEPEGLAIGGGEALARGLRAGDRLIGQLAERVACRVIGRARRPAVDLQRFVLAIVARQHQHLVDDAAIVVPARLELVVEIALRGIVTDGFEFALGRRRWSDRVPPSPFRSRRPRTGRTTTDCRLRRRGSPRCNC